ncbi:MAG: hypothetical protein MJZ02_00075 [Paludibacteraceae bacterium]|nr:hypothetical protein [Paludibacteraceae bacterium]
MAQKVTVGTSSTYTDGAFHTTSAYIVDAPVSELDKVLHEIYVGIQDKPTKNLKWLWKNLGHHSNVEDDVVLSERGFSFDPRTSSYLLKLGLAMHKGDKPMLFNVEGKLRESTTGGKKNVLLTVTKKIKILNSASFSLTSVPQAGGKSLILVKSDMAFGWFFNMFFTESRYRSIMEWRIQGLTMNVKKRVEGDTSPNY